jgi:hypothetical protein
MVCFQLSFKQLAYSPYMLILDLYPDIHGNPIPLDKSNTHSQYGPFMECEH